MTTHSSGYPTPWDFLFLPGKSHGRRSLGGYSPWGCKESDMTEQPTHTLCMYSLKKKKMNEGLPWGFQWLGLHAPNAGWLDLILGQGARSHMQLGVHTLRLKKDPTCRYFAVALLVKNLPANKGDARDAALIPASGRFPVGGNGNPLQDSCLENLTDRGAWWYAVHRVVKSQTRLKRLGIHIHASTKTHRVLGLVT